MNRILPIIRKEFIHVLRDRRALMIAFLTPVIQMIILGYAATTDVRNVPLAVLDQDRTRQSRALIDAFVQSGQFTVYSYVTSERDLAAQIDSGQVRAGLIIPPDYGQTVTAGRNADVIFILDGSDPSVASSALSSARLIGASLATRVREEKLARRGVTTVTMPGAPQVRERVWYNPDMDSAVFMVPGLIGLVLQFQATLLTASAVVRERERGTIEQLIVTPIRPYELMLGKILPYAVIELLVVGEVLLVGTLWFGVPIRGSLILLVAIACLFLVSTLALGLLISTIAHIGRCCVAENNHLDHRRQEGNHQRAPVTQNVDEFLANDRQDAVHNGDDASPQSPGTPARESRAAVHPIPGIAS